MDFRVGCLVAVLLVAGVAPVAGAGTAAPDGAGDGTTASVADDVRAADVVATGAAATSDGDIHQRKSLALTPEAPGTIRATVAYDLPDSVYELEVTLPERATVVEANGFERVGDRRYAWDGATSSPALAFDFAVNQTFGGARAPVRNDSAGATPTDGATADAARATEDFSFVDAGPWALTKVPSLSVNWAWRSAGPSTVRLQRSLAIEGEGATGGEIAYLGPARTYERRANGQRFELVVPAAAEMRADPAAVFDSLAHASGALLVGDRDPEVFYVAAPTGVDWGPRGLEYGGSDAWVRADAPLSSPTNVWLHEYVHTRQAFATTESTRWVTEGSADYYAALLTFRQGHVGFDAFADHLERGTNPKYDDAVLSRPDTWSGSANYLKGALVYGALDRRIRLAGDRSADTVLGRMNADGDTVTQAEFLAAVEAAGGADARADAERYTETAEEPAMWTRAEHYEAFPGERAVVYDVAAADLRVSGPFRNRSVSEGTTLVTGETLRVTVPVRNTGDEEAAFEVVVQRNGSTVVSDAGTIPAGVERTVTLTVPLRDPGTYTVAAGVNALPLTVREPAPVEVRSLSAPSFAAGETGTAEATVVGAADRPAAGTVRWQFRDAEVGEQRVTLDADGEATVSTTLTADTPGTYVLRANNATTQVTVAERSPGVTSRPTPLSWPAVVAGLALAVLVLARKDD
jgi:hypothetical protein